MDMRTPVRFALIAMGANLAFKLALMSPLGHTGLALATTVAALVNAALLLRGLLASGAFHPGPGWAALLAKGVGASLLMGLMLHAGTGPVADWLAMDSADRVWRLCLLVLAGGGVYAAALLAVGVRPRHFKEG
jgi:putative peptidoglycan lipid II flippase